MHFRFLARGHGRSKSKDRHARPKELSDLVGIYMVTKLNQDPDWVWSLRMVERCHGDKGNLYDFRIFDPKDVRINHITVENYESLDNHPDRILYAGTVDKARDAIQIVKPAHAA